MWRLIVVFELIYSTFQVVNLSISYLTGMIYYFSWNLSYLTYKELPHKEHFEFFILFYLIITNSKFHPIILINHII